MPQSKRQTVMKSKIKPSNQLRAPQEIKPVSVPMACTFCENPGADFQCCICGSLYCGVRCQLSDWQYHRNNRCLPRLIKATPVYCAPEFWASLGNLPCPTATQNGAQRPPTPKKSRPQMPVSSNVNSTIASAEVNTVTSSTNAKLSLPSTNSTVARAEVNIATSSANAKLSVSNTNSTIAPAEANIITIPSKLSLQKRRSSVPMPLSPSQRLESMPIPLEQADFSVPPPQIISYFPAPPVKEPPSAEVNRKKKGIAEVANTARPKSSSKKEEHGKQPTPKSSEDGKVTNPSAKYMEESILCAIVPNEQKVEQKPLLPKQTTAKKRFLRPSAFPNPGEKVTISHVEDSTIYIYGVGHGPNGSPSPYIQYMKCMMKAARETKEHLSKPPELGDIVFAPLESVYYRAVVKSIDGANVKVIFPEFGNSATVDWKMFKVIHDLNMKYARCMTYEVSIQNVPQFTKLMYEFLKKLIDTEEFEISNVFNLPNTHIKMVDLLHTFENYVLSKKLLSLVKNETNEKDTVKERTNPAPKQLAAYFPDSNMPLFFDEFKRSSLPVGIGIKLSMVNGTEIVTSNSIAVVLQSEIPLLEKITQQCNQYGQMDPTPYVAQDNEACLVNWNGLWRRATSLGDGLYHLLDVDFACTLDNKCNVRRYPLELSRKLYVHCVTVKNPSVLRNAIGCNENKTWTLVGRSLKADVYREGTVYYAIIESVHE